MAGIQRQDRVRYRWSRLGMSNSSSYRGLAEQGPRSGAQNNPKMTTAVSETPNAVLVTVPFVADIPNASPAFLPIGDEGQVL